MENDNADRSSRILVLKIENPTNFDPYQSLMHSFIERVQPDAQAIVELSFQAPFEAQNCAQLRGSRIDMVPQHSGHLLQPPPGKHYLHFGAKCTAWA